MKGSKGFLILVVVVIAIPVIYFILKGKKPTPQRNIDIPIVQPIQPSVRPVVPVVPIQPIIKPVVPVRPVQPIIKPTVPIKPVVPIIKPTVPIQPIIKPVVPVVQDQPMIKPDIPKEKIYNFLDVKNIDGNDILKKFFDQPIEYLKNKKISNRVNYNKKDINTSKKINVLNAEKLFDMDRTYMYYDEDGKKKYEFKDALVTLNDTDKKLLENYFYDQKVYMKNMSERNKLLLKTYIQEAYTLYNRFLRQEKDIVDGNFTSDYTLKNLYKNDTSLFNLENPRKTMNNLSKELNQLILNAPRLPISLTTFRASTDPYYFNELEAVTNEKGETEYIYTSTGFLSTAIGFYRTTTLQTHFMNREQTCCISIIYLPKDTRGLYIYNNNETELLLPLYSRLKYLGEKQMTIDELQKFINYQSLQYPDLKNILNRSPTITVYEWEYMPPVSDTYVELYRYRDMY